MTKQNGVSRRNLLKGFGLSAVGITTLGFSGAVQGQDDMMMPMLGSVYTFSLGDWTGYVIKDNGFMLPANVIGANGDPDEVAAYFEGIGALSSEGTVGASVNILVLTNGEETIMVDAGTGNGLMPMLDALGIGAEGVTTILMTHWHGDHVGGLLADGAVAFPNASLYFPQGDWDFLQEGPEDAVGTSRNIIQTYVDAEQVTFISAGETMIDGNIEAVATPGHTPGHTAYLITAGDSQVMHIGDAIANAYASTENPGWFFGFDADGDTAVETRKSVMTRAADENIMLLGYHFAFPGMGYVIANDDGESWRFYPAST